MMGMETVREMLDNLEFDWQHSVIIYQSTHGCSPGWANSLHIDRAIKISKDDPLLDRPFCSGYGAAECPRIFARDANFVYFPVQYDGSTWIEKVAIDPAYYMEEGVLTPYPGG